MIRVIIEGLVKRYGPVAAVDGASLEIGSGELLCVLGPSGAGKTTLGRLVAGLEDCDDGEIYFNERIIHRLPPSRRRVGFVFPDFALWPSLSVAQNVGFPLKIQGQERSQRRARSERRSRSCGSTALRQAARRALTRPVVARGAGAGHRDRAGTLDPRRALEPFDSRGREEAWDEIRRLRGELGITTMLLTRVVPEALAYADRLAVMDLGRILQVGPPCELYNHPADVFVARLLGPTNLVQGQIDNPGGEPRREVVVRTPLGRLVARVTNRAQACHRAHP